MAKATRKKVQLKPRQSKRQKPISNARGHEDSKIVILGIGNAGKSVVDRLNDDVKGAKCVSVDADVFQQVATVEENERTGHLSSLVTSAEVIFVAVASEDLSSMSCALRVAEMAHRKDHVAVAVVTVPFRAEREGINAQVDAVTRMHSVYDTVLIIDGSRIRNEFSNLPLSEVQKVMNQTSANTIKNIVETITAPALINLDYDDFRKIIQNGRFATVGLGESTAPNRAEEAVQDAFSNPMLGHSQATGALINISGDGHLTIEEANRVGEIVSNKIGPHALVRWGARSNRDAEGFLKVTLVMTGLDSPKIFSESDIIMPGLFDIESSYIEPERELKIDLDLDQIENFDE